MKHAHYQVLREHVRGEFDLLAELEGSSDRGACLAASVADGTFVLLVLQPVASGEMALDVVRELNTVHRIGWTHCWQCPTVAAGWPRICARCQHNLSGVPVPADGPGTLVEKLEHAIRTGWPGWQLLGHMPHEGGGVMYFARADESAPVIGFVIDDVEGTWTVVECWGPDQTTLLKIAGATTREDDLPPRRIMPWAAMVTVLLGALAFAAAGDRQIDNRNDSPHSGNLPRDTTVVDSNPVVHIPTGPTSKSSDSTRTRPASEERDSVIVADTLVPLTPPRDTLLDKQQVRELASGFADAFETRDITRVRAAFPGISAEEDRDWSRWFSQIDDLQVGFVPDSGLELDGDSASLRFTLVLRYPNRGTMQSESRRCRVFDGTMRRHAGVWHLDDLQEPLRLGDRECRRVEQRLH